MGLPWVRLDTQWPHNPKFLMLAEDRKWRAIACYMAGLAYCGAQGTDGFIPRQALRYLHAKTADAAALVDVGLWRTSTDGWHVVDWDSSLIGIDSVDRTAIPLAVREAVLERDGLICQLCRGAVDPSDVHLDHIKPWSKGGKHTVDNLQVTHSLCNLRKAARWNGEGR